MLTNSSNFEVSDFEVNDFNIFRLIFSAEFNITSSNNKLRSTSPKEEVVKITSSADEARSTRL